MRSFVHYRGAIVSAGTALAMVGLACPSQAQSSPGSTGSTDQVQASQPGQSGQTAPSQSAPAQSPAGQSTPQTPPAQQPGGQTQAPPSTPPSHRFTLYLGPDIGVYFPTHGKTAERFGGAWLGIGVGIGSIGQARRNGKFEFDLTILSQTSGNDYVEVGLIGARYRRLLSIKSRGDLLAPYYGASADLMVGDIRSLEDDVHAGIRSGIAGSLFLGLDIGRRAFLEARYLETSVMKGFDLSGYSLSAGYRFRF